MKNRLRWISLLLLLVMLMPAGSLAAEGREITRECKISLAAHHKDRDALFDRKFMTGWSRYGKREGQIEITLPREVKEGGIYLCFAQEPALLELYQGGGKEPIHRLDGLPFAHLYLPFQGNEPLKLRMLGGEKGLTLSELYVFTGPEPPAFVQRWLPTLEKADLMVLVAHPDDELLWMGGALPYYSAVRGMDVAVCYMTCANPLRRAEMLNGLWAAGVRHYPIIGAFRDKRVQGMKESYRIWGGEDKVNGFVTGLVRRLKPAVLLSHDVKGEYGHPAHILTSKAAVVAAERADDPGFHPASAKKYGAWALPKLYLHLFPEQQLTMDWTVKSDALGGKSPIEATMLAFEHHRSQKQKWAVETGGKYSPSRFGLAHSRVGEDLHKNDFFEHIPGREK